MHLLPPLVVRRRSLTRLLAAAVIAASLASTLAPGASAQSAPRKWAASWTMAPSGTFTGPTSGVPALDLSFALPNARTDGANEQTLRMIVKPDLWSKKMRFKLTNVFGTKTITFGAVTVGLNTYAGNILPGTNTPVTFNGGSATVAVPAGQEIFSDEVVLKFVKNDTDPVVQGRNLAVSMYVQGTSGPLTYHNAAFQTSYLSASGSGDRTADNNDAAYPYSTASSFLLSAVDVRTYTNTVVLVGSGSSSTDGYYSTLNGHDRFLDDMARRLHEAYGNQVSVVNEGIGGDVAALPGPGGLQFIQQYLQTRLDRDVIGVSGVTHVILYVGVNDYTIAQQRSDATIAAYQSIVQRLRAAGIKVIMATITSTVGEANIGGSADALANYAAVNRYIRTSGLFDSVADFGLATSDPSTGDVSADTARLYLNFAAHSTIDSTADFLHQGRAGMQAEANTLDLSVLAPAAR